METRKKRSIEAFRFLFMGVICIWHYYGPDGFIKHGYLCVDFFFMLSGMLLYNTFVSKRIGALEYTLKKMRRFLPEYLLCMLLLYTGKILNSQSFAITEVYQFISEALMLQDVGLWNRGMNWSLWYLSVLIYGGAYLYAILGFNRDLCIRALYPALILIGYTYIFSSGGSNCLEVWNGGGNELEISLPLLRGLCDMALGILVMYVFKVKFCRHSRGLKMSLDGLSILSLILFTEMLFNIEDNDSYSLIFFSVILVACFYEYSFLNLLFKSAIWEKLGGITYEMLIIHVPCLGMLNIIIKYTGISNSLFLYLFLVLFCSVALKYFYSYLDKKWLSQNQK